MCSEVETARVHSYDVRHIRFDVHGLVRTATYEAMVTSGSRGSRAPVKPHRKLRVILWLVSRSFVDSDVTMTPRQSWLANENSDGIPPVCTKMTVRGSSSSRSRASSAARALPV